MSFEVLCWSWLWFWFPQELVRQEPVPRAGRPRGSAEALLPTRVHSPAQGGRPQIGNCVEEQDSPLNEGQNRLHVGFLQQENES